MAPNWSAALRAQLTESPSRSFAGWSRGGTLVVWAFDASGSLQAERQRLGKHIETIYTHIDQLDDNRLSHDSGLLTMVVGFGHDRQPMLVKPTAERSEIIEAIKECLWIRPASRRPSPRSPRSSIAGAATRMRTTMSITRWSSS